MSFIVDFKIGDKFYKKKDETIDKSSIYIIKDVYEEDGGNWHDGFQKSLYVIFENESKPYLLAHKTLGSEMCIYGMKVE